MGNTPSDRSRTLVVGVSSTALFDLEQVDREFRKAEAQDREAAMEAYRKSMREQEDDPLEPGTAMPVVRALLGLNRFTPEGEPPLVEVLVMSRNSPETGVRILNTIRSMDLGITRSAFTGGEPVARLLGAFGLDLFLSTAEGDVQAAIDDGSCAAALLGGPPPPAPEEDGRVRIAFDGDGVLFDEASELRNKTDGLAAFREFEDSRTDEAMEDGPYANLLRKLASLQERLPVSVEYSPVRVSIVTARDAPADLRVIKTLRKWGVYVDEAYFLGGWKKAPVLAAIRPHIFFDDQDTHLREAAKIVPSARVPYASDSALGALEAAKAGREEEAPE